MSKKDKTNVNIVFKAVLAITLILALIMINQIDKVAESASMMAFLVVSLVFLFVVMTLIPSSSKKRN